MHKNIGRKGLVIGIIILFVGASCIPTTLSFTEKNDQETSERSEDWWDNEWLYRKTIWINSSYVDDDFVNFPILVNITDSDLASKAQSDGDDIVFINATGTKLNHEIEKYTSATGKLVAWVNIPSLSSTVNTTIVMYYGNSDCSSQQNANDVWDNDFLAVWHMVDTSDSTSNGYDLTNYGADSGQTGYVGDCYKFEYDNTDYMIHGTLLDTIPNDEVTYEAWFKTESIPDIMKIICKDQSNDDAVYTDIHTNGSLRWFSEQGDPCDHYILYTPPDTIQNGTWYYIGETYKYNVPLVMKLNDNYYVDDENAGHTADGSVYDFSVGYRNRLTQHYFDGLLDELRVHNVKRSSEWINTSYNTMNEPELFMSFGNEERINQAPEIPDINGPTSGQTGTTYTYTFVAIDPDDDNIYYEIDWGDGNVEGWHGPYESNEVITKDHSWEMKGTFTIKARAKDIYDEIGNWGTLEVEMPVNQIKVVSHNLLLQLLIRKLMF